MATTKIGWTKDEKWLWGVALVLYTLGAVWAIVSAPDLLVTVSLDSRTGDVPASESERLTAVSAARQSVLLAAGGGLALLTLLVTVGRDAIARARAEQERDEKVSAQFTEAVGQLAAGAGLPLRLGGIYGLERIATSSADHRLGALAVLAQYIREHGEAPELADEDRSVAPDVETAAEALARLTAVAPSPQSLSLNGANLFGVNLRGADFSAWSLVAFEAQGADFDGAKMVNLKSGNIRLVKATFKNATLKGADFFSGSFNEADFRGADLTDAKFRHARMWGAKFMRTTLLRTDFRDASLKEANFAGADLTNALFAGADLSGAHMVGARGLTIAQLTSGAIWDEATTWPASLVEPLRRHRLASFGSFKKGNGSHVAVRS